VENSSTEEKDKDVKRMQDHISLSSISSKVLELAGKSDRLLFSIEFEALDYCLANVSDAILSSSQASFDILKALSCYSVEIIVSCFYVSQMIKVKRFFVSHSLVPANT